MKHLVYKTIRAHPEVDDFVRATHKFGKKFYRIAIHGGEYNPYRIVITVVAISRDVIYKITWGMDAETYEDEAIKNDPDLIGVVDHLRVYKGDMPIHAWIPKHKKDLQKLYPNFGQVPNEPGEHHWITLFESWAFTRVDNIEAIE